MSLPCVWKIGREELDGRLVVWLDGELRLMWNYFGDFVNARYEFRGVIFAWKLE